MTMRMFLFFVLISIVPATYNTLSGQRFQSIEAAEDTLSAVLASLNLATGDSSRDLLNQTFSDVLLETLKISASDSYPFESLKTLVKITSPDHRFRIFHWSLISGEGKHKYYGFIKLLDHSPPSVYPLVDLSDSLPAPDTALLDNMHWLGALYYKVISGETAKGEKIYTLLGWAGRNSTFTQKIIEVLFFDEQEKPHFGVKIFPDYKQGNMTRVIFRFAASTTMSIKYEKQVIASNKKWNAKKKEFAYTLDEALMIVCDRMVPLDPQLEGQYQFYIPSGDIYDGFAFERNCWRFISGIDPRNKK